MKISTCLFDFDGVVADTEPQYDLFWTGIGEKYHIGVPDFAAKIKGTTLQRIYDLYFPDFSEEEREKITAACTRFEEEMAFPEVPGAIRFLHTLKEKGYRVGLVTSSPALKMEKALKKMKLETVFDTIVTADRITRGKPDPMCYLTAAADFGIPAAACVVFEDAFTGIQAATTAGMRVIGLSTTNSAEAIRDRVFAVIPDFSDVHKVLSLILK